MATTTAKKPAKAGGHGSVEHLQGALDELTKARERAGEDIRGRIEAAIDRTRDAMKEAGTETQDQIGDWQKSLEKATDDLRREFGLVAVRAQRSPEALRAMSAEIRKRKAEITPAG
ncbi:MAG TPA: hypothetical protein VFQ12_12065 [Thermoleophilaceae bacterium]|nr:hypothetical protein [Thermoleophilaceae bacterium]